MAGLVALGTDEVLRLVRVWEALPAALRGLLQAVCLDPWDEAAACALVDWLAESGRLPEPLARAVVAEREACARLVEDRSPSVRYRDTGGFPDAYELEDDAAATLEAAARAIRARGVRGMKDGLHAADPGAGTESVYEVSDPGWSPARDR